MTAWQLDRLQSQVYSPAAGAAAWLTRGLRVRVDDHGRGVDVVSVPAGKSGARGRSRGGGAPSDGRGSLCSRDAARRAGARPPHAPAGAERRHVRGLRVARARCVRARGRPPLPRVRVQTCIPVAALLARADASLRSSTACTATATVAATPRVRARRAAHRKTEVRPFSPLVAGIRPRPLADTRRRPRARCSGHCAPARPQPAAREARRSSSSSRRQLCF